MAGFFIILILLLLGINVEFKIDQTVYKCNASISASHGLHIGCSELGKDSKSILS